MTKYRLCTRCVMDTNAADIKFNNKGQCSYCSSYIERSNKMKINDSQTKIEMLEIIIEEIKRNGKDKPYDCIVGVSGGADSSWMLVQAVKYGLKPLAIHMDNGWNSALAQSNISNIVKQLDIDLYTHVIDWIEYKKMMQAFFDADVIDVELLYDNAMLAVNYRLAKRYNIKYILSGSNQATEGIYTPKNWNWYKKDKKNIKSILRKNGNVKTRTFPFISTIDHIWFEHILNIKWYSLLDYIEYNKNDAMKYMQENYGFKIYSHKHYESIFTRFYQGYILPEKFNVDKRRLHLSALIVSSQITRDQALNELQEIPYSDKKTLEHDKRYFLKKMGWQEQYLIDYIKRPEMPHDRYASEKVIKEKIYRFGKKAIHIKSRIHNFFNT